MLQETINYSLPQKAFIISFGKIINRLSALFAIIYLSYHLPQEVYGSYRQVWLLFNRYDINTKSVDIKSGKTFSWGGRYNEDYSRRDTLFTELGVFKNFKPKLNEKFNNPILYLGNIQPELQFDVIKKIDKPHLIAADSMNLWIDTSPDMVWKLISKVDIFMLNDEEACQLTKKDNLENIADKLLNKGPKIIIIKMGSKGAMIAYGNK